MYQVGEGWRSVVADFLTNKQKWDQHYILQKGKGKVAREPEVAGLTGLAGIIREWEEVRAKKKIKRKNVGTGDSIPSSPFLLFLIGQRRLSELS